MTDAKATALNAITSCRHCGGKDLAWDTHYKSDSMVPEGRLRTNEVKCLFVLGCVECSETLAVVGADKVAAHLSLPMTGSNSPSALVEAADNELVALRRNAARWNYYAGRVASMMGISLEQMVREIDEAMEAEKPTSERN